MKEKNKMKDIKYLYGIGVIVFVMFLFWYFKG